MSVAVSLTASWMTRKNQSLETLLNLIKGIQNDAQPSLSSLDTEREEKERFDIYAKEEQIIQK